MAARDLVHSFSTGRPKIGPLALAVHMPPLPSDFEAPIGGVFARDRWLRFGGSDAELRRSLRAGVFRRVAPGWYALPDASSHAVKAVQVGGRVTCSSALALLGAWDLKSPLTHVRVRLGAGGEMRRRAGGTRDVAAQSRAGVRLHRRPRSLALPLGKDAVDDVESAVGSALLCLDEPDLVVVVDSLLQRRILEFGTLEAFAARVPSGALSKLRYVSGAAMSGTESKVRFWLQSGGHRVEPQSWFEGVGFVDLLVDGWLVIECDSRLHHTDQAAFEGDRSRDLVLNGVRVHSRVRVVRLSYRQVMFDWEATTLALLGVLEQGPSASRLRARRRRGRGFS